MIEALQNAFRLPDLRRKMLYTLLILVVYQFAAHVTVPGVECEAMDRLFDEDGAGFLNVLNLLSGGAVSNFSVIANGVYPYITASIIIQLLTPIIPQLQELSMEGESGRNKINKLTYYITVPLAFLQAIGQRIPDIREQRRRDERGQDRRQQVHEPAGHDDRDQPVDTQVSFHAFLQHARGATTTKHSPHR